MDVPSIWQERLAAWRASKLSAVEFCAGRDFTVHSLRQWRGRELEAERRASAVKAATRLARVEVTAQPRLAAVCCAATGVALEVGVVRVTLDRSFDRATLAAALEVIGATREARP